MYLLSKPWQTKHSNLILVFRYTYIYIYRESVRGHRWKKKRRTERESERESKEKHTHNNSERHSEKITSTYYSDSEHGSLADQSHMFSKKSMPNKLESFYSGFVHRTKTQDKVLTQLLIGKPGASEFDMIPISA